MKEIVLLHNCNNDGKPILVNVRQLICAEPAEDHSGSTVEMMDRMVEVEETVEEIYAMLNK